MLQSVWGNLMSRLVERLDGESKDGFLWRLYNDWGCSDLRIACSWQTPNGLIFSKWYKYHKLLQYPRTTYLPDIKMQRQQFIDKASHRTVLDIELLIDVDEVGKFKSIRNKAISICKKLNAANIAYSCHFTGSKSYHISIIVPQLRGCKHYEAMDIRGKLLKHLGADIQKASSNSMIAMEGEPHYKSGKIKEKVLLI